MALIDFVQLGSTTPSYSTTGGGTATSGSLSRDGDFNTAYSITSNGGHTISSTQMFGSAQSVSQVNYRIYVTAHAYGDSGASAAAQWYVEYTIDNGANWTIIDQFSG